jgi:hypothetical protein
VGGVEETIRFIVDSRRTEVHRASVHNRSQFQIICLRLDTLPDLQNFSPHYNRLIMTSDTSPFAIGISIARALAGKFRR